MVAEKIGKRAFLEISDVRERFDEVFARVEDGESVAILRDGRVIAELLPGPEQQIDPDVRREAFERFLEERAKWPRTNVTREEILASRHEGHRV